MKTPRRRRSKQESRLDRGTRLKKPPAESWMNQLASVAAESRLDGGERLHRLLHHARFDERPHLSLTKRAAA